ncbi:unnamed protein product [Anisakis simplex]|uniref:Ovule protein n=1 Tax=Anisakis simplex TaxID=6269 RepID=A0A0M3JZU8_ANISI|nr:unnamed protein product [Anisakis simplex]
MFLEYSLEFEKNFTDLKKVMRTFENGSGASGKSMQNSGIDFFGPPFRSNPTVRKAKKDGIFVSGCDPELFCCPLKRANGTIDCNRGYRLEQNRRVECIPLTC